MAVEYGEHEDPFDSLFLVLYIGPISRFPRVFNCYVTITQERPLCRL